MIATYIKYTKNTEEQVEKEEKNHMKERTHCYIPLTIERKLKAYSESPDHIERHENNAEDGQAVDDPVLVDIDETDRGIHQEVNLVEQKRGVAVQ